MTVRINASSDGLTETVDTSGILEFQTANTSALVIDTSQNANFTSTGAITVPVGTTAQRPTGANGMIRYNTTTAAFEYFANNTWALANVTPPPVNTVAPAITGSALVGSNLTCSTGTWTGSPTSYAYQWRANSVNITANATSNVFTLTSTQTGANITCNVTAINAAGNSTPATSNSVGPVSNLVTANYLLAGGGGGGAGNHGGGGGAGGFADSTQSPVVNTSLTLTGGSVYTITIGSGGSPSARGSNTSIVGFGVSVTGLGGGNGAGGDGGTGAPGGSGGGAGGQNANEGAFSSGGAATQPASATGGYGNQGGSTQITTGIGQSSGGGGGGAGGAGGSTNSNGTGSAGGGGGAGRQSSITGSAVFYAGGGGGGAWPDGQNASGGSGGGGTGTPNTGANGAANSGGGGGGGNNSGGSGGSGIVILSVPTSAYSNVYTGANVVITTSGSNTIIRFNSSGTYTA